MHLSPSWWQVLVEQLGDGSVEDSGGDQEAQPVSPVLSRGGHAALPGPREL